MASYFKNLETAPTGSHHDWGEALDALKFGADGLIPAIAQQYASKEVVMMAWMNREALEETLQTGRVCYWSRSRQKLWRKGESSGQIQQLKELRIDCDGDALLILVDQTGPACHTGRRSCFYSVVKDGALEVDSSPLVDPSELYGNK
ncbi:MAG: phosphoribosyl-AMP cyclohydrolase [bacterium]